MSSVNGSIRWLFSVGMGCLLGVLASGCASSKIDWENRVGQFTYDQAILEMGPPDKTATLNDGRIVAEWMTSRSYYPGYGLGAGRYYNRRYRGAYVYRSHPAQMVEWFTRLVFDAEQKLVDYQQLSK